jgi:hypothetical protein
MDLSAVRDPRRSIRRSEGGVLEVLERRSGGKAMWVTFSWNR